MPTQAQFLFLLFRAADRSDDPLAYLVDTAYDHAAELDSPNSPDYARAVDELQTRWLDHYEAWIDLGRPTIVDGYTVAPVASDPFACSDYSLGDPDRQVVPPGY